MGGILFILYFTLLYEIFLSKKGFQELQEKFKSLPGLINKRGGSECHLFILSKKWYLLVPFLSNEPGTAWDCTRALKFSHPCSVYRTGFITKAKLIYV
jgi:hypothetical protein